MQRGPGHEPGPRCRPRSVREQLPDPSRMPCRTVRVFYAVEGKPVAGSAVAFGPGWASCFDHGHRPSRDPKWMSGCRPQRRDRGSHGNYDQEGGATSRALFRARRSLCRGRLRRTKWKRSPCRPRRQGVVCRFCMIAQGRRWPHGRASCCSARWYPEDSAVEVLDPQALGLEPCGI